ncbi:MAG: hypothetical protein Q3979_09955 [Actinomycetaceae bacterium]|nr:hypothetical protein [Actinomycetaceae bacterium]
MRINKALSTLAVAAALALSGTLAACGSDDSGPSQASSSQTSRKTVGTVDPLMDHKGAKDAGLTKATFSIEAEPGLTNYDWNGITYIEPRKDPAADLVVHRLDWEGKELWKGTVPVQGADEDKPPQPQISYDDGLGVIAIWFNASADDTSNPGGALYGPLTWLDLETGEAHVEQLPVADGNHVYSLPKLIGGYERTPDGQTIGLIYLDSNRQLASSAFTDIFDQDGKILESGQTQGTPYFFWATDETSETTTLTVGQTAVLPDLPKTSKYVLSPSSMIVTDPEGSRLWMIRNGGDVSPIDTKGCPVPTGETIRESYSGSQYFVGQLLINEDLSSICLKDMLGDDNAQINGVLDDGRILVSAPKENEETSAVELYSKDLKSHESLGKLARFNLRGGHLVFTGEKNDVEIVTAFDERDIHSKK